MGADFSSMFIDNIFLRGENFWAPRFLTMRCGSWHFADDLGMGNLEIPDQ